MLLKVYLLPLAPILLLLQCRYVFIFYNDLSHFYFYCVVFLSIDKLMPSVAK